MTVKKYVESNTYVVSIKPEWATSNFALGRASKALTEPLYLESVDTTVRLLAVGAAASNHRDLLLNIYAQRRE